MAIRRNKAKESLEIPEVLETMLLQGFTFQAVRDKYGEAFDETKVRVVNYLEHNTDDFTVDLGKGFKCDQGTVIYQQRTNWTMDKDKIINLVKSGAVTLETIINLATFNAEKLKTAIGERAFNDLAECKPTEFLAFKATPDFKASVESKFADLMPRNPAIVTSPAIPVERIPSVIESIPAMPAAQPGSSATISPVERARQAAARAKAKPVASIDDEINAILAKGKKS